MTSCSGMVAMVLAEDIAMDERYLEPRAGDEGWGARSWRLMRSWFFEFFYMWIRFRLIVPEMSRNANFFSTVEPNRPSIGCSFSSRDPDRSKSNCFLAIINIIVRCTRWVGQRSLAKAKNNCRSNEKRTLLVSLLMWKRTGGPRCWTLWVRSDWARISWASPPSPLEESGTKETLD